jgi:hypothetical protein
MPLKTIAEKVYHTIFSNDFEAQKELEQYYYSHAEFVDPLVSVKNKQDILSQFRFITWLNPKAETQCVFLSTQGTRGKGISLKKILF